MIVTLVGLFRLMAGLPAQPGFASLFFRDKARETWLAGGNFSSQNDFS
ncbi:MAG: hypothetical protein NC911_08525 [Candidatus Omnitrophica bacterium]|nr:hypothetical protein [Candidatus Omnitrophota bacterium]